MDAPVIDPAYLAHPEDLKLQLEGVREARRIVAATPLKDHWTHEILLGPSVVTDAALEANLRANSDCIWHPVGTCRMGPGQDAVVDSELRVHGLRGLRVVDASVMPQITSGNTNAPTRS